MKKVKVFLKENSKVVVAFILGLIISGTGVYAATILFQSDQVGYDNTDSGMTATDVQAAIDELYQKASTCSNSPVKLGDYIYLVPDVQEFTIYSSMTGYSSNQTIQIAGTSDTTGLRLWRVIDIHSDGSFDAVSEYVTKDAVFFTGATGYQYYVSTLQLIASQYAKAGYTIGTRMMGYDGQTLTISDTSAFNGLGDSSNLPSKTSTPQPITGTGEEFFGGIAGDTLYLKDYQLVGNVYKADTSTYGSTGLKAYNVSNTSSAKAYWLASRGFHYDDASSFYFRGRYLGRDGDLSDYDLRYFYYSWDDDSSRYSLRPILTLKSGLTTSGGSGTKDSPYTLS